MPTVVITGATRGLGLELARIYSSRQWTVVGTRRASSNSSALNEVATSVELDTGDAESIAGFGDRLAGVTDRIDLLVNNAGIGLSGAPSGPSTWPLAALDMPALTAVFQTNAIAPLLVTSQCLPLMADGGWVVTMSSKLGSIALNFGVDYGYNGSKAALNMGTALMAKELSSAGIGAIAVHPGWLRTDMGGPHAELDPAEGMNALVETIATLDRAQSGSFIDWLGRPMPW
jgi:NAD(P)-dependent dehydrogenase (short-subunit alcohol dehydrogenase family)